MKQLFFKVERDKIDKKKYDVFYLRNEELFLIGSFEKRFFRQMKWNQNVFYELTIGEKQLIELYDDKIQLLAQKAIKDKSEKFSL